MGLAGCSPEFALQGAYFPLWLVAAVLGILAALLVRMVLIKLQIDEGIPFRSLVYIALAATIALIISATALGY
jgi:hypothetical protein